MGRLGSACPTTPSPNMCLSTQAIRRAGQLSAATQFGGTSLEPSFARDRSLVQLPAVVHNQPLLDARLIGCPDCDLLQRIPQLAPGASARCPRCSRDLWRRREDSLNRTLALAVAAAVLYIVANVTPMLGLAAVGHKAFTTVFGGAVQLWHDEEKIVAVLVLITAVIAPALQIGFMLAIVLGARPRRPSRWVGTLLRHQPTTRLWSMIEVMMLGVLVALIKIAELATVIPGVALYTLGALVFLLAAMQANFDPKEVWDRIEWAAARDPRAEESS